jgi:hypothetical protein
VSVRRTRALAAPLAPTLEEEANGLASWRQGGLPQGQRRLGTRCAAMSASAADIARALNGHRCGAGWVCRCPAHDDRRPSLSVAETKIGKVLVRCCAGCSQDAVMIDGSPSDHGWSDSEEQAMAAVRAAITRLADGHPHSAHLFHRMASHRLKKINAEKRRFGLPSAAKDSRVVEYLYGRAYFSDHLCRFRITKRTAERIYYLRAGEGVDERDEPHDDGRYRDPSDRERIGFIDRQLLDAYGSVKNHGRYWSAIDYRLFASLEAVLADQPRNDRKPPDLAALKAAMAAAHPDKGGSPAAFIEARQRYVAARRACRSAAEAV